MTSGAINRHKYLLIKPGNGHDEESFHIVGPGATTLNGEMMLCWVDQEGAVIAIGNDDTVDVHLIDDLLHKL